MAKINHTKQSAVFDYANKHKLPYAYCKPCETESPTHKGSCLVCGTANEDVKKKWFRIDEPKSKDDVEYSTNFKFFVENQIRVVRSGKQHSFCSNLEAKIFKVVDAVNREGRLSEAEIEVYIKAIHKEILAGKHGAGQFVD